MKKYFYLLCGVLFFNQSAIAAAGDTTWVQANIVNLTGGGNFDTTINFPAPGTTYRNIYMIFTLGKYACAGYDPANPGDQPGQTGWCGDWDYTVKNQLMTPGGDTLELGRFITPYANSLAPRTPLTWKQRYVYDVTDYASKLQGSASMRIAFDAGSGGFTGNIRFAFVEGIPARTVTGIKKLWAGSFNYGGTPDINVNFPAKSETAPVGAASAELKVTVTGHGSDANGCCEFAPHNYQVMLNGSSIATTTVWRNNCGLNDLYPQSGTWLYDRGNWCPGATVYSDYYKLTGITAGSSYNVGLQFDPYTGGGYYITVGTLINYGPMNKTVDASLDQIIAPTSDENHFRENPVSISPKVHIKNTGATTITGMQLTCYVDGGAPFVYDWTGSLASLAETDITLPAMPDLKTIGGTSGTHSFMAKITMVNGAAGDDDATNNTMTSSFVAAPQWPIPFKIQMRTNNQTAGVSETGWQIFNESGAVVASRMGGALSTTYTDTLGLGPGAYKLVLTDGGCDGLYWWLHNAVGDGVTAGNFYVRKITGQTIPLNGYSYTGSYNNDFGCSFTQYFTLAWPVAVDDIAESKLAFEAYPNPAQNTVNINIYGMQQVHGKITITDMLGRVVSETACMDATSRIDISALQNGVYTLLFTDDKQSGNKLTTRLLIAK